MEYTFSGTQGRTRTDTPLRTFDFKSNMSTYSTTRALIRVNTLRAKGKTGHQVIQADRMTPRYTSV